MGDIFREVDEELRQEGYERLWRRYGKYVIGVAVAAIVAVAGWKGWESWQASQRHAEGLRFQTAVTLAQEGRIEQAAAAFAALGAGSDSGYGLLSRFHQASLAADAAAAVEIYNAISVNGRVPGSIRELATILAGLHALRVSSIPADAVEARIGPLTAAGRPFRHIALEILALSAHGSGASEKALANYRSIVDDAEAPAGIRARASRMVSILDNGGTAR